MQKRNGGAQDMTTTAEMLRQFDVTAAAWRLTLDAATGKRVRRRAAIRTLIAAGADPEHAKTLTVLVVDARKAPKPPTPARGRKLQYGLTSANAKRTKKVPGHCL